jgi:hypothetical protein
VEKLGLWWIVMGVCRVGEASMFHRKLFFRFVIETLDERTSLTIKRSREHVPSLQSKQVPDT